MPRQTAPNSPLLQYHLPVSAFLLQVRLPSAPVPFPVGCCITQSFQLPLKRSAAPQSHIVCTPKNLSFSLFLTIHYLFLTIVFPHPGWFIRLFFYFFPINYQPARSLLPYKNKQESPDNHIPLLQVSLLYSGLIQNHVPCPLPRYAHDRLFP